MFPRKKLDFDNPNTRSSFANVISIMNKQTKPTSIQNSGSTLSTAPASIILEAQAANTESYTEYSFEYLTTKSTRAREAETDTHCRSKSDSHLLLDEEGHHLHLAMF